MQAYNRETGRQMRPHPTDPEDKNIMPKAYLKPTKERRVEMGHPWIFRSDIDRV